jgi:hypothetical protein
MVRVILMRVQAVVSPARAFFAHVNQFLLTIAKRQSEYPKINGNRSVGCIAVSGISML